MSETILEIKRILLSIEQTGYSLYETIVSFLRIDMYKIEYISLIILFLCIIFFIKKRTKRLPASLQQRIITRLQEQNSSIDKAKLYIHIFTTTIAEYRKNVDLFLEKKPSLRGMLLLQTVGGKIPIFTSDSFHRLLYCAIAFAHKAGPFEKEPKKQKEYIMKTLGFLPTIDTNSKSPYHTYMALSEYTSNTKSIYSLREESS